MINRSSFMFKRPRSENLNSYRSSNDHLTGSNEKFLLVPISKDLYVLKNIQDTSETNIDGMIIPKRYKLLEKNKNKGNATSAILSFKAHIHHDVKDVGRAYLHHRASNNHHLSDYDTNYLYTDFNSRVLEKNTENLTPLSYPNFLYPGIAFQTRPDLIDAVPKILDQQITLRVPDYKYITFVDIDSNTEIVPYDSSTIPSTSPFFDMSNYDISSYPKKNANNRRSNILHAIKVDELNPQPDSGNYENSLEYSELIESTTTDFQNTFGTLDDNTDAPVTLKNTEMDDDKELFDVSKNIENNFKVSIESNKNRINVIGNISTQYKSAFDASVNQDNNSFSNNFFVNNIENNNQDTNEDNTGSGISISGEYSDEKSTYFNDFNYDNKFIDETLFSKYTTIKLDSFFNIENYTTSASLLFDTDEWSFNKKQSNVGNPRALLKAIEPLSSELKKLLTAVKLVNQSISNVQNRLCDKKNVVRSARIERESKERKATNIAESINRKDNFDLFMENFDNQSLDQKQIKIKGKNIVDRTSNVEFKRKTTTNHYFLNKLMTPLQKHESSISSNRGMSNDRRNFLKKRKLNKNKFPKSDNIEKHRLPHLRFNRNLKSLSKNYKLQPKPIRQFVESRLKRVIRTTTADVISSYPLIESNVSSKNNFINGYTQDSRENESISLSGHNTLSKFSDMPADKDNQMNFLSNNNQDLTRYNVTNKLSNDEENKYSPVDPQFYREATAYLDILRLLNMTKKPYIEHSTDIVANITESLISEIFVTTTIISPYPIERSTTITSRTTIAWRQESPEVTESVLYDYLTGTDYKYYDEQNYTNIYEDYGYEDRGNVTSWYDYMEETTTEKKAISATTIKDLIPKFVETTRGVEITTPTKKKIDYEVVETISLTRLSVTLSAFTITMPTTLSQLYTTELPIFPIDEEIFTTEITTEETALTVAMPTEITETFIIIPTTIEFTTESVMLLTPFLENMTDITLRITIPAATSRISIEETSMTTEKEILESTSTTLTTEVTSFLAETSISLFIISTVPSFTTAELTIQITTPTVSIDLIPLTVAKRPRITTPIEETTSVTERMITSVSPTIIPTKSTAIFGENTTLYRAITSKITYVTRIETEIEDLISFTTQALTLTTHIPTSTLKITEETSLVAEKIKTTSIENMTTTESTYITIPSITQFTPTVQVAESTTETSITISKITVVKYTITTITSSPTTSERTETVLSTSTEIAMTTLTSEEESPVTQIEKTITAEEMTTTESPTTIETLMTTEILTISETSVFNETSTSSTIPTIEVSSISSAETLLTTTETTITKILTPSEISTITDTLPTENRTITKPLTTTEISTLIEIPVTTEIQTTIKTLITETIESSSTSSVIPVSVTAIKTVPTTLLITTKRPATTSVKTTVSITSLKLTTSTPLSLITNTTLKETPYTTISGTFLTTTKEPTTTASVKTTVPTTTLKLTTTTPLPLNLKILTPSEISTITDTLPTENRTITKPLTTTEISTLIEIPVTTEIQTTIKTLITETIESSSTSSVIPVSVTAIKTVPTTLLITTKRPATTSVKTTVSITSLKLTTSTPLSLITNTTLKETPYTTISGTFLTTTKEPTTTASVKTTVPTTTLKLTTTTPLPLVTNTTLSETPYITISSTFLTTTIVPTTTASVKTTVPTTTLKLTTTMPLPLVTNTTLMISETPYTTISSTFLTTTIEPTTTASVKTTVPTTLLKLTTTTPLSLVTNTTLSETPCTISTTFLTEEIENTTFSITSTISTIKILPTTLSTLITTTPFLNTSVAINKTLFTTIFTTFKTASIEMTTFSMTPITTTSPFEVTSTLTPSIVDTNTTLSEIIFSTFSTEIVEEATTLMTYLPLNTTMFFVETTAETTLFVTETITAISSEEISTIEEVTAVSFITITEESSLIEEIINVTSTTVGISIPTKITLTFTERSTTPAIETSIANTSLASTIAMTTVSLLRETTTETIKTSLITTTATLLPPITEEPEQITISKTEMTFTPLSEFTSSVLITSETPAITPEVISVLPQTVSDEREFTTILTSPSITYTLESFTTLSIERTVQPTVSTLAATTEEMLEVETEYYIAEEPFYEEEYEDYVEYDIPTDKWYDYEEYETTAKIRTTVVSSTAKYTELSTEAATSPSFEEGTTSSYETKTLEFTMYSTTSTSIYTDVILTATTTKIPYTYTEEEFTLISALETSAMTIIENITTIEVGTEFTTSITSKEEESTTMALTFGSTEEYTLLPSTAFEIMTEPLEYLTIPPKFTKPTSKFLAWYDVTAPKFTKPKEISEIELEKTSTSERILTKTEFTEEKLTSFFISSILTTLSERETIEIYATTASIAFSEMETAYEVTTSATMLITKEEITPYTTMFTAPENKTEFITMRQTTIGQEEERKILLQLLEYLEQREREVAEREEKLKKKELQWEKEKEMMQREKEKAKNITTVTSTTTGYVTTTIIDTVTIPVDIFSTQNLTAAPTAEIKVTSFVLDTSSLAEIIITSTETMPYITEEGIFATYITEKTEETSIKESTFPTYIAEVTEETAIFYTTEESTSVTYITKETEEIYITNYTTLTSYITASIVDLYNISLVSIETTTSYTTEEIYTTSYGTAYLSEPLSTSSTMLFTSPITLAVDEFTIITKESYTTSYITLCSEFPFISSTMTLTSRITEPIDITILPISITTPISYATEETIDIYSESLFTSPASVFIKTTTALAISITTEMEYDEEIESLKEKLLKKERELKEREKMLLEKEERLEKDIIEFELYMKEFEKEKMYTLIASSEKPIVSTSLSTPVPPTEKTTIKAQVTTQIKKVTEKEENQTTTTKMVTSRHETTKIKDVEEKERTSHVPEKIATQVEEKIVTKKICLNVLENTTIPFVIKKMCLPYFPEKNRKQKSVNHLSRKLLSFPNTRKIRESQFQNLPSDFRYRGTRAIETTRKIDNLQLSYREWLTNETTKPMRHFKGFTRIYGKKGRFYLKKISTTTNMQENYIYNFRDKTPLSEQRILDSYESLFRSTATFMLDNKKYRKRNVFFKHNLIPARRNNFSNNNKYIENRNALSTEKNTRSWMRENAANVSNQKARSIITEEENLDEKENEFYTVNVLHLSYNKDRETHEVISAKPNENELTMIMSESIDNNNVTKFDEGGKITPYNELEEKSDLQEEDILQEEEKLQEDSFEDMLENYMNYEERTTSAPTRDDKFLDRGETESEIGSKTKFLDQMWPTEKSTTYHLGGTRYWELEVTEPVSAVFIVFSITTDFTTKTKAIDVSITRTTCLYVILKNEINTDAKTKRNIHHHKRNVYKNETRKNNISIEKQKIGLKNITRENTQNLRGLNRYEQKSGGKRKFDEFSRINNEDSIIAKTRKLCSVNGIKSKHQIIKHKDTMDTKNKTKKKQSTKSQKLQNINSRSPKSCTNNCIMNKKNSGKIITRTTTNQSILNRISFSLDEIKALNCSVYKETQDKIVISMDSDAEEAREFSQPHYNTESLKGQKYIKLEELEDDFKSDLELGNDHDIVSLPGLNLNLPCNQDGDGITWLSSISRPSYAWKRTDGIAIFGFVAENGDLELRNVNAKDTGNYTCVTTYMGPETEEPVETTYEIHLQVVTLPRYIIHGENCYYTRSCDERDLDILMTYLPIKLNDIICEADICNAYILTPSCSRSQITVNILLLPSHIVKLMTIDPKHCNIFCLKAIQDKLSLILSKNLRIFFGKTIIFRLPHYEQRLVPIAEKSTFARWKRGRTNAFAGKASNIGLFSSCPAGYGLRGTHCVPCNMGTYSEDGISYCKKCPSGTYQPNHGARICRTCTDPLTKGCYNMLWSSFSAIMITLASLGVMLSIFLLFLWIICCAKKKFCVKKIASIIPKEDAFEQENPIEEQSLINDVSENQDQQWDNEYKTKKKKKKFYLHEDEWGSHRVKNIPIICPDSYRSHEDYNNCEHIFQHIKYINV
ncbi:mucin-3A-like [Formica exsecta]|uniref:mucin-3A-like n=1 Tax=Formica exsecta TaxID=72781 RepID=UPI001144ADDB|nr:mucin-3A-like [Formica exsecta]